MTWRDEPTLEQEVISALGELQREIHKVSTDHGFWEDHRNLNSMQLRYGNEFSIDKQLPDILLQISRAMLIVTEISEGVEALRDGDRKDDKLPEFSGFTVELADALIRVFDLAEHFQLPVIEAMLDKIEYNKLRPFKHGKSI
jgi:NTP pyrophosphatase (non-canonical NTP hydrolase)